VEENVCCYKNNNKEEEETEKIGRKEKNCSLDKKNTKKPLRCLGYDSFKN
jgi:hypothetical protein